MNDPQQTPQPRRRYLLKLILLLAGGSLLIALALVFGTARLKSFFPSLLRGSTAVSEMSAPPPAAPDPVPAEPVDPPGRVLAKLVVQGEVLARKKAVTDLSVLPDPQPEAVAFLTESLAVSSANVKADIIAGLGLLAKRNPEAVAPLVAALNDPSARLEAMAALGSLGRQAKDAVPVLKKIIANKKEPLGVRNTAGKALTQIEGKKPKQPVKKGKGKKRKK